jgi:hypothetical protein
VTSPVLLIRRQLELPGFSVDRYPLFPWCKSYSKPDELRGSGQLLDGRRSISEANIQDREN